MNISFEQRISLPQDVLISNIQNEAVILNLASERYFGLNEVGTRFLTLLTANSIQRAYEVLLTEYDVDPEVLRRDLSELLTQLLEQGLVEVVTD